MRIAALMTCHNRKEKTLKCLASLDTATSGIEVFLVDDGSSDGTYAAVAEFFPSVHVIKGDGNLFWSRGMYAAWMKALEYRFDYYLWLNDDVELHPDFLETMLQSYRLAGGGGCVVSGLVSDIASKSLLYGGYDAKGMLAKECDVPMDVKFMNGNVVLIPQQVVDKIGIIDPFFHHDLGDVDYGLMAQEHGIRVVTSTRIVAECDPNRICRIRKWGVTIFQRFKLLQSPLGSPLDICFYFNKKHFGFCYAIAKFSFVLLLNILPDSVVELLWGDKYR